VREVLRAREAPEVTFVSTEVAREKDGFRVRGDLTIAGRTRSIAFVTRADDGKEVAEISLHQPDFGITPYKAMLGTLRVQPDVRVRVAAKIA
jgi:polyisoprenoid-binding protein YceI